MSNPYQSFHGNRWAMVTASILCFCYVTYFVACAYQYFINKNGDAVLVLSYIGWPSSMIASGLSNLIGNKIFGAWTYSSIYESRALLDWPFLLIFGVIQYGGIGYVVGKILFGIKEMIVDHPQ